MSDWNFLNRYRLRRGQFGSDASFGFNGAFRFPVPGEARAVCCIASDGEGWQHVSVSFGSENTHIPPYHVMCAVKNLFWEPEDWVVQFHPAKSEHVNNHPGVLHLWRPLNEKMPVPPSILVGIKEAGNLYEKARHETTD